jgi:DNA repair protein RecO
MAGFAKSVKGIWSILMTIRGFVLRHTPYRNHDGILTVLTATGYVTIQGRGILKVTSSLSAATTPGTLAQFKVSSTSRKMYLESATIEAFTPLADQDGFWGSLMMAAALEMSLLSDDDTTAPALFTALVDFRKNLNHPFLAWASFLIQFLIIQGIPLTTDYCVRCHSKKKIVAMSIPLGGFICESCLAKGDAKTLPRNQLLTLLKLNRRQLPLPEDDVQKVVIILHRYVVHHLDVELQGLKTLDKVITP